VGKLENPKMDSPFDISAEQAYADWRGQKLENLTADRNSGFVPLGDVAKLRESERLELVRRCRETNSAFYQIDSPEASRESLRDDLRTFAETMGLQIAENHRSADPDGIVALTVSEKPSQRGYIPYSRRPMNWHTDGYYNAVDQQIRAMVLHCATPAADGGQNQFLDPELVYIRLRDLSPEHIVALSHPEAMSIPENIEPDGSVRPVSIGPVFSVDSMGHLAMRYTARTRSINWRTTPEVTAAEAALRGILESNDPLMTTLQFQAGEGVLCNNVLHNRTGFDPDTNLSSDRLVYRVRFHNRVKGS
jgi:hypothetical protein